MANRKKKETKKVTASKMAKAILDGPAVVLDEKAVAKIVKTPQQAFDEGVKARKEKFEKNGWTLPSPAGNSGIPAPAKHGFNGRMVKLLTKDLPNNQKIPPQAMIILDTIEALGGDKSPVSQGEIVDNLVANGLKTVQTPKRIYDFYRKDLIERKLIDFA